MAHWRDVFCDFKCRLKFDNSYFKYIKEQYDDELLVLETDDVLFKDDGFRWVSIGACPLQSCD
jgi:hypothetical protein